MQKIVWELECLSAPKVIKYCKRCEAKKKYESSGLFRINAQRKSLDVWLIYKCENCNDTWNAKIYDRISPQKIDAQTLERFHQNDRQLADSYAMNFEWLKKNQADVDLPAYVVRGPDLSFGSDTEIWIKNPSVLPYRISTVLRKKLSLSRNQFEDFILQCQLKSSTDGDLKKAKLSKEAVIIYYK